MSRLNRFLLFLLGSSLLLSSCAAYRDTLIEKQAAGGIPKTAVLRDLRRVTPATLPDHAYREMDYGISPWFRSSQVAVSLTFDDGTLDQYLLGYSELAKRNIRATFFLITSFRGEQGFWQDGPDSRELLSWDQAREIARSGHEIGSHGRVHRLLLGRSGPVEEELRESRAKIEREIRKQKCVSFCWPFWKSDEESRFLASLYYLSARAGGPSPERYPDKNGGIPLPDPSDLYQINSLGILASSPLEVWLEAGQSITGKMGWAVINLHGIDDGTIPREALGWQALPLDIYRDLLEYISAQDAWIAPFGEVARYIHERQASALKLFRRSANRIILVL